MCDNHAKLGIPGISAHFKDFIIVWISHSHNDYMILHCSLNESNALWLTSSQCQRTLVSLFLGEVTLVWPHFLPSFVEGASICFVCPTVMIYALFLRICALLWPLIAVVSEYRLYVVTLRFNPILIWKKPVYLVSLVQKFDLLALTFKPASCNLIIISPSPWSCFFRFPKVMPS